MTKNSNLGLSHDYYCKSFPSMQFPRFFQDEPLTVGQTLELSAKNFRHAIQVLRLKPDDKLTLFNGEGGQYQARLTSVGRRSASVKILGFEPVERESSLTTQLVLALIKPDKMDFALQKAVELGVSGIQPVQTQRTVINIKSSRMEKKLQHWRSVVINACEQCGRNRIPEVFPPVPLQDYLATQTASLRLALSPVAAVPIDNLSDPEQSSVDVLIGPEGGFTNEELAAIQKQDITLISLGSRILRAETAAIAMLALVQSAWGDV